LKALDSSFRWNDELDLTGRRR